MARYQKFLIIIPTAATIAALNTLSAFSAGSYEAEKLGESTPIMMSSVSSKILDRDDAIAEDMTSNFSEDYEDYQVSQEEIDKFERKIGIGEGS